MKKDRNSLNNKAFLAAAVLGVAAVAAVSVAAVSSSLNRLTPTENTSSQSTWIFSAPDDTPDTPVNVSKSGVEKDKNPVHTVEEASSPVTEEAEQVNKPVKATLRNIMPVEGEVSHPFSNGELVKSETLGVWKTHDGCDILCPIGTEVKSMSAGTVSEMRDDPLWGVTVVIEQDNGYTVEYCGLAKELEIKTGQQVNEGQIIGKTSDTFQVEIVQPPHLHLGVKQGDAWIDPMSIIG